jgi:hypothetical protein
MNQLKVFNQKNSGFFHFFLPEGRRKTVSLKATPRKDNYKFFSVVGNQLTNFCEFVN